MNNQIESDITERLLTKEVFEEKLLKNDSYYEHRWPYFEEVIIQLRKMEDVHKVLELGPYKSESFKNFVDLKIFIKK